jgi:hypothetical protein
MAVNGQSYSPYRHRICPSTGAGGRPGPLLMRASESLGRGSRVPAMDDELRIGEMWNSNSVISWLIACSGLDIESIRPPLGGRAPGWRAGIVMARRQQRASAASIRSPSSDALLVRRGDPRRLTRFRPQSDGAFMEPSGRNRSQLAGAERAESSPKPLPWLATGCRSERMVRRRSSRAFQ